MTHFLDFEKVELLGKVILTEEISRFVGSGQMGFWMPVAVLTDGKIYTAIEVSTPIEHDDAITLAINNNYSVVNYYRIPRKYTEFFKGRAYYSNPNLP